MLAKKVPKEWRSLVERILSSGVHTEVDKTREDTGAKTSNRGRRLELLALRIGVKWSY